MYRIIKLYIDLYKQTNEKDIKHPPNIKIYM